MVLLEAATAGVPAVAFDCPTGPGEIIDHGRNGLLVPPQDVTALADGMLRLIENPAERRALGAAARAGSSRFAMATVRQDWERLFVELAETRSRPAVPKQRAGGRQRSTQDSRHQ